VHKFAEAVMVEEPEHELCGTNPDPSERITRRRKAARK